MPEALTFSVPGMSCEHCEAAVSESIASVAGVTGVSVDLETKLVVVSGDALSDDALRAAIEDAGYEAAP